MGGSSGGSANTVSEFKPPAYAQDYWKDYLGQAANLTSQAPTMWQGPRVADLAPQTQQAMDMTTQWATNSTPDVLAGRGAITDIAGGKYLNSNPYLGENSAYTNSVIGDNARNMANSYATGTAAQNASLANMQGAFGGSGYAQKQAMDAAAMEKNVGQMANQYQLDRTRLGAADYQQGLQQMLSAGQMAPALQNMDLQASQALAGVGDMQRGYQQQLMDTMYNTWKEGQMAPFQNLDIFRNALTAASGGMGTNTTYQNAGGFSPLAGLLGGATAGYGVYNALKG